METSTWATAGSCQAYFGQHSKPFVNRQDQQDGTRGQNSWNPTTNFQQYLPMISATQAPQGQCPSPIGAYATEQLSNQNASSKWVTTSSQGGHTNVNHFLRTPSMLEKANSQTTCVDKAHGNHPLPCGGNFPRQHREDFKAQPVNSRGSPQISPSAINTHHSTNAYCLQGPTHGGQHGEQQVRCRENPQATPATTVGHGNNQIHRQQLLLSLLQSNTPSQYNPQSRGSSNYDSHVQSAQTSSPVTPTACSMSFPTDMQRMCLPQNQPASCGNGMSSGQSGMSAVSGPSMLPSQKSHHQPFNTNNHSHRAVPTKNASSRQILPKPSTNQQQQSNPASYISFQSIPGFHNASIVARGTNVGLQHTHHPQMHHIIGHATPNQPCTANAEQNGGTQRNVQFAGQDEALPSYKTAMRECRITNSNLYSHALEQQKTNGAPLYVTNDQSGNEFKAQNVNFGGCKPVENIQGQQQQGPSASNESQTMNMYELVTHNHFNFQQYSASGPSAQHGQKAIAVVQPLSTEQQVMATDTMTSKTPQKTTQTTSASEPLKLYSTTKGQHTLSPAQGQGEEREVPVPCSEETDCSVTSAEGVLELSPIPTIPWTLEKCTDLLKLCQNFSEKDSAIEKDVASTILTHYWGGSYDRLLFMLQSDYYKKFMECVTKSCGNMKSPHVIFSQVDPKHMDRLKDKFNILGHGAVYFEEVHKSLWLNTNEKLDDIDNDFGFPCCLKRTQPTSQMEEHPELKQPEQHGAEETMTSEQPHGQMQDAVMVPPENVPSRPESKDAKEIQELCLTDSSTETTSPDEVECSEDCSSSDPFTSIEIHVLAPEEAKRLYECVQGQSEKTTDQEKEDGSLQNCPVKEESSEEMDVESKEWTSENKEEGQIEKYCCLLKLMSEMRGLNNACQCEANLGLARPPLDNNHVETDNTPVSSVLTENEPNSIVVDLDEDLEAYVESQSSCSPSRAPVPDLTMNISDDDDVMVTLLTEQEIQALQASSQIHVNEDTSGKNPVELKVILKLPLSEKVELPSSEKVDYLASLSLIQKHESVTSKRKCEDKGRKKRVGRKRKLCLENLELVPKSSKSKMSKRALTIGSSSLLQPDLSEYWPFKDFKLVKSKPKWSPEVNQAEANSSQKLTGPGGVNSSLQGSMITLALFGSSRNNHGDVQTSRSKDEPFKSTRHNHFEDRTLVPPQTLTLRLRTPEPRSPVKERLFRDWKDSFVPTVKKKSKRGRPCKVKKLDVDVKEPTQTRPSETEMCPPRVSRGKPRGGSGGMRQSLPDSKKADLLKKLKLRLEKSKIHAATISSSEETKSKCQNPVFNPTKENSVLEYSLQPKTFIFKELEPQSAAN
ncbi:uncharacterized protein si:ch211-106e7.2 [Osmerus eperlanus]|uniref:uncharacterized protein si:ch211-106e7.2 n=1 Tax=Osmerus eperlanus TaxID=29151 RepID=UPI002E0F2092